MEIEIPAETFRHLQRFHGSCFVQVPKKVVGRFIANNANIQIINFVCEETRRRIPRACGYALEEDRLFVDRHIVVRMWLS